MRTLHPTQIGYTETGNALGANIVLGRDTSVAKGGFEAYGFGKYGRPDYAQNIIANLTYRYQDNNYLIAKISMKGSDMASIMTANGNLNGTVTLALKEVSVCEVDSQGNSVEKKMIILGSPTYAVQDSKTPAGPLPPRLPNPEVQ